MYPNLRFEMIKANISIVSLAGRIGVSEKTLRNKIKGETDFTWKEALTVRRIVNPQMSMEEMFLNDEVNKKSSEVDRQVELSRKKNIELEIRALEIDFDKQVLKINGEPVTKPVLVTLPGEEGWPLRLLFNHECRYVLKGEYDELEVIYSAGDQ